MKLKEIKLPKCPRCKNQLVIIGALSYKNILIRRQFFCWNCGKQYIDLDEGKDIEKIIKRLKQRKER